MDEAKIVSKILETGGNGGILLFVLYVAWQIKTNLKHVESSLDRICDTVNRLSTSVDRICVEQAHGKEETERIRADIKSIWERLNPKA